MNSMKDLWDSVLKRLSGELSETTINTWFDEVTVVTMEDSAFVLHCSNTFKKNTIEARFLPHIKAALKDLFSTDLEVKILDDDRPITAWRPTAPATCRNPRRSPSRRMWWDPRTSWPLPRPRP